MTPEEARERFSAARVARLATVSAAGIPHLVPVTFAVRGDEVAFAVDHKPKSTVALRRLANIAENPAVCFLADGYDEDWSRLWWARADGSARVLPPGAEPVSWLVEKYEQYRERPPEHAVVVTTVHTWSGWASA
ncbi:PPOX class F420-dependent oxidoreductase [Amycolatopsis sp. NBRC 101858]|uniref:TIGR03668 family PPOX class F420-dependent oxidoreductase n=1 Tax=Amycolatopsis sp. NBRC 101858 TaxID=3032200 RepID=UPI0024A361A5|nr:TIGR03668 family PPOX class F420-dependent oxidoreductase [Amycolatopsis sp. NBRC 101858]GLY36956.1 PPOX class F420-dependent oxidoreductase [Amycolatopsis sp. NBRC 101858]